MKVRKGDLPKDVRVDSKALASLLKEANRFASSWQAGMICADVLIQARNGKFEAMASDAKAFFRATIDSDGLLDPVRVDPKTILKLIGGYDGLVRIANGVSKLEVVSDINMKVGCREKDDFPISPIADKEDVRSMSVRGDDFVTHLEYVGRAVHDNKSNLMGVMIEKGLLKATDGHRGAQTIGTEFWPRDKRLFLPTIVCDSVVSIASKGFESIELSEKDKFGVIRGETSKGSIRSFEISFCLTGENFPDLDKVVPSDIKHEFSVDIKLLSNVLSKFMKLAEKPENGLMFRADDGSNMLTISSGETIESEVVIDNISVTSRIVFCLNPSYVIDAIKIPGAEIVRVRIVDAMAPVLFENEEFRSIVMPIRL